MDTDFRAMETKAVTDTDDIMRTFDAFKSANDERLAAMERRADVLIEEMLARIDEALARKVDELTLKAARPPLGRDVDAAPASRREHKAAFESYVRNGESTGLRALEVKALSASSNPDGGYLVPVEIETDIGRRLTNISPIRSISGVRTVTASVYKKPFMISGPAVGWVGETDARPQTATPTLDSLSFPAMELYAMPAATATLLEDTAVNLDQWIAAEVEQVFAEQESAAFVAGDGVNKPKGFLSYTTVANTSWSWGNVGYLASGAAGAFAASNPSDVLVDLIYALKAGYRQNAVFVMNRKTQAEIRKFKDSTGAYLWQPPAQAGGRASLMTFPVVEAEDMPNIAANSLSVAFGDFSRGYLIVDRAGVRVLRDPYSAKPYVLFIHHKAGGRRHPGLRRHQAVEVFGVVRWGVRSPSLAGEGAAACARPRSICCSLLESLMAQFDPAWLEFQRRRWLRPDASRYMRPNAHLYLRPNWCDRKYSPDQPRVPAGNPDGGQWTSGGGGATSAISDVARAHGLIPGAQYVQNETQRRYSVSLEEEDARGGHTTKKHVGKSDEELLSVLGKNYHVGVFSYQFQDAEGSFASVESANDLVNRVLEKHQGEVDLVASGGIDVMKLEQRFGYVTGREAFRPDVYSAPFMRSTYAKHLCGAGYHQA